MSNDFKSYIKHRKAIGWTEQDIRNELNSSGWSMQQIDEQLSKLESEKQASSKHGKILLIVGIIVVIGVAVALAAYYFSQKPVSTANNNTFTTGAANTAGLKNDIAHSQINVSSNSTTNSANTTRTTSNAATNSVITNSTINSVTNSPLGSAATNTSTMVTNPDGSTTTTTTNPDGTTTTTVTNSDGTLTTTTTPATSTTTNTSATPANSAPTNTTTTTTTTNTNTSNTSTTNTPPPPTNTTVQIYNGTVSTQCTQDSDCTIIDSTQDRSQCCINQECTNYSGLQYVAVNSSSLALLDQSIYDVNSCLLTQCIGPDSCPSSSGTYIAACVNSVCTKKLQ